MKHSYTPFLAIFLIFIIIGFSYYKQSETQEGMTNMDPMEHPVIQRGNNKVRRKRNHQILESLKKLKKPKKPKPINIGAEFKKVGNFFKKIGNAFKALGSNIKCGLGKIKSMPSCMQWYMLEVFGKILYFPITFIVWVFSRSGVREVARAEKEVWRQIGNLDKLAYKSAGIHIMHYPDDIVNKCYKCKGLIPFPKF
jgi:hypothetical protein